MNGFYPNQKQPFTNVRLVDKFRHIGLEAFCDVSKPDLRSDILHFKEELKIYQELEPDMGWVLEVRGTQADWHKMEGT